MESLRFWSVMFTKRLQIKLKIGKAANIILSRTGGFAAGLRVAKGLTINSKHGLRISKSFNGLTIAYQNKGIHYRGRWSSRSGLNLNLSKKGFSVSQSFGKGSPISGSYNFTNPRKSSLTIFGIQQRGKSTEPFASYLALSAVFWNLIKLIFYLLSIPLKILYFFISRYLIFWTLELFIFYSKLILIVIRYMLEITFSSIQFVCISIYSILGMCLNLILFTTKQFKEDLFDKNTSKLKFFSRYGWIPILFLSLFLKIYINFTDMAGSQFYFYPYF